MTESRGDDRTIFRLLQISDLHFGHVTGSGSAVLDATVPSLLARSSHFDGLLGHHKRALSDLLRFRDELLLDGPEPVVVVSGDLTVDGSPDQFALAHAYLGLGIPIGRSRLGLGLNAWAERAVPGNHDQWPGSPWIIGPSTRALRATLPGPYPNDRVVLRLEGGHAVRLIRVDSDADVGPYSANRVMARGGFVTQLERLHRELPAPEPGEVRVLVIHHALVMDDSPEVDGDVLYPRRRWRPLRFLEIDRPSRRVLEDFLVDHAIDVVLTGHLHRPRLTSILANNGVTRRVVLESRCGSTTQRDRYPYGVRARVSRARSLVPNTLVLHELILRPGGPIWRARIFWRDPFRAFVEDLSHASWQPPRHMSRDLALLRPGRP